MRQHNNYNHLTSQFDILHVQLKINKNGAFVKEQSIVYASRVPRLKSLGTITRLNVVNSSPEKFDEIKLQKKKEKVNRRRDFPPAMITIFTIIFVCAAVVKKNKFHVYGNMFGIVMSQKKIEIGLNTQIRYIFEIVFNINVQFNARTVLWNLKTTFDMCIKIILLISV